MEPSLKCRCGGEYVRQTVGGLTRTYAGFECPQCHRTFGGPIEIEADLRYELQQMNLKLPDGWVLPDEMATVFHRDADVWFVYEGDKLVDGCPPINRRQAEPKPATLEENLENYEYDGDGFDRLIGLARLRNVTGTTEAGWWL